MPTLQGRLGSLQYLYSRLGVIASKPTSSPLTPLVWEPAGTGRIIKSSEAEAPELLTQEETKKTLRLFGLPQRLARQCALAYSG